jgi:5-methylcytosine-specific restriction endonuclease McrA
MLLSAIGRVWMFWPGRLEAKRRCKVLNKTGWWKCELCKQEREKIQIDHINPVVLPSVGFVDWNVYIASKFVEANQLQALCVDCHRTKTKAENKIRREVKKRKS